MFWAIFWIALFGMLLLLLFSAYTNDDSSDNEEARFYTETTEYYD